LLHPEHHYKHILRLGQQQDSPKKFVRQVSISKADTRKSIRDKSILKVVKEEMENLPDFSIEFD
jgi:hypothetical protein